jgi:hypothetical protein
MASRGCGRNGINDAQAPVVGRTEVGPCFRGLLCLVALSYKRGCQEKYLTSGLEPELFSSRHPAP